MAGLTTFQTFQVIDSYRFSRIEFPAIECGSGLSFDTGLQAATFKGFEEVVRAARHRRNRFRRDGVV